MAQGLTYDIKYSFPFTRSIKTPMPFFPPTEFTHRNNNIVPSITVPLNKQYQRNGVSYDSDNDKNKVLKKLVSMYKHYSYSQNVPLYHIYKN